MKTVILPSRPIFAAATLLLVWSLDVLAAPLGAGFTYQGRLNVGTNAANALYEMQFSLYDAATNGNLVGGPFEVAPVSVSNGLFTVTLDFGSVVFDGNARWLEVTLTLYGSDMVPTILLPRQAITAAPYALAASHLMGVIRDDARTRQEFLRLARGS